MRIHRLVHFTLFALCVATFTPGCRQVRPEAGLPPAVFEGPTPKITSNDRGFWFLVTDGEAEFTPYVEVKSGDTYELFYVAPRGERTVRLLPVSPFAYPMLDGARDGTVEVRWLNDPTEVSEEFTDSIGWVEKKSSKVEWTGQAPEDGTPVALLSARAPQDLRLSKWLLGVATLRNGRLSKLVRDPEADGPFVVVPDGNLSTGPYQVRTRNAAIDEVPQTNVVSTDVAVPQGTPTRYSWRPAALDSGGDLYVGRHDGAPVAMAANPVVVNGLPLAVTQEPLGTSPKRVTHLVRGFQAASNQRFLTASFWFARAQPKVGGNIYAGALRALELIAAAGYVDWMRQAVLVNASGLNADAALYLARGHYVAGDYERAGDFAERAVERFSVWRRPASHIGGGRARMLQARLAADRGEFEVAHDRAVAAAEMFDEVDDAMRAADAELHASIYGLNAQNAGSAVKTAALARSRFYHGKSPYWSGFAEIALSDVYRRVGEVGEAEKMARFAALRFDDLGNDVGRNRARIAEGRVQGERSPAQGKQKLELAFERARDEGDVGGLLDAAASLVVLGAADSNTTATYGMVILSGLDRTDDPFLRERANQALALLCSRGLAGAVEKASGATSTDIANARAACNVAGDREPDDTMVSALVAQGYAALSAGDLTEARALADRATDSIDEDLRVDAPTQAAEAIFLDAVVQRREGEGNADQKVLEGVRLLGQSIDPTRLATTYAELADRFVARGQVWLATELLRAGVAAAGDQGQTQLRRKLAMRRLKVLHSVGKLDEARRAAVAAEPMVEGAGPAAPPLLAELWTYQADILHRLDRDADANLAEDKAVAELEETDGPTQVKLTLLATRLALGRNDLTAAQSKLERAAALEKGLQTGLDAQETRQVLRARISTLHAELAERRGDTAQANKHYREAVATLASLASDPEVLRARIRALSGAALTATSDDVVNDSIRDLEAARDAASRKAPDQVPAAIERLGRVEISAGRPSRALDLVKEARLAGTAHGTTATDALCLEARASGLSGVKGVADRLRRCAEKSSVPRKVDASLLAAFADPDLSDRQRQRVARQLDASYAAELSARQLQRLKLVSEVVVGEQKPNEGREKRLRRALQRADERGDGEKIVDATTDLVEYLVSAGKAQDATTILDNHSKWFYEAEPESPGRLVRLQTQAKVASLDPIGAAAFAARALSETPDISEEDEAELLFAAAINDVLLGMWQQARSRVDRALEQADAARDRRLQRRVREFGKRFSLISSD